MAISISLTSHSCQAPLYNQTQQSFIQGSPAAFNLFKDSKTMSRQTLWVPCGSARSPAQYTWCGLIDLQQFHRDLDILLTHRIFLNGAGFIKRKVQKMNSCLPEFLHTDRWRWLHVRRIKPFNRADFRRIHSGGFFIFQVTFGIFQDLGRSFVVNAGTAIQIQRQNPQNGLQIHP